MSTSTLAYADDDLTQDFGLVRQKLSHLPVAGLLRDLVDSVKKNSANIISAKTGSGKTLLASTALADASDHQVLVLVPRRFLAVNAAESVAELSETRLGEEVGFATGEGTQFGPNTKLLFATYGYALQAGLIDKAKTIVLDEVHEEGIDQTLARAIVHRKLQRGDDLRVLEMSATMDAQKQAEFWEDAHHGKDKKPATIFHAEGHAFDCEYKEGTNGQTIEERTVSLIKEGRNGIAVFRPGVGEVEGSAKKIEELLRKAGIHNVEISTIYGDMDMEERARATEPPAPGNKKILIGTNVMESGVNIEWLDAGISDGLGKVRYDRNSGADALVTEDLPQWRIIQQQGRVHRFRPGLFVLHSDTKLEKRSIKQDAEITRISVNGLVMHTAHLGIEDPTGLKFGYNINKKFAAAREDLKRLGLLTKDWRLTEKGEFVAKAPVSVEAGTILWAAVHRAPPEALKDTIALASIAETGNLRADFRRGHGMDERSDILDALKAYQYLESMGDEVNEEACLRQNVSWKRFKETRTRIKDIIERLDDRIPLPEQSLPDNKERDKLLKQVLLYGSINHLFESNDNINYSPLLASEQSYRRDRRSVVKDKGLQKHFSIGHLREIAADKSPVTIMERVTPISQEEFLRFAGDNPGLLTDVKMDWKPETGKPPLKFSALYCGSGKRRSFKVPYNTPQLLPALLGEANADLLSQVNFATDTGREQTRNAQQDRHPPSHQSRRPNGKGNTEATDQDEVVRRARRGVKRTGSSDESWANNHGRSRSNNHGPQKRGRH